MDFYRRVLFPLLGIMYSLTAPAASQTDTPFYPPSSGEAFRNIIVGDSHVLIGSTTSVHRINPTSLALEDSREFGSANRMLVTDPRGTFSGNVLACTSVECTLSPISNLTDIQWQVPNGGPSGVIRPGTENVLGSFAPGANRTSSLSFGEQETSDTTSLSTIRRGNLVNVNVTGSYFFNRYATQGELRFTPRNFLTTFNSQSFIYFIVRIGLLMNGMQVDQLRVVRFCQEDAGSSVSDQFVSHFELVAECSGSSSGIPTAATYVGTNSAFGNDTFLVAFTVDGNGGSARVQHLCAYDINTVNARMMQKFDDCLSGIGRSGFTRDTQPGTCPSGLTQEQIRNANPCSLPGLLLPGQEVENPLVQQTLVEQPILGGYFTSLVYNTLDNTQFIFAGTNEGRLYQYHIVNSTRSVLVRNITLQFSSSTGTNETNVTQLRTSSDGQHIYVLTPKKLIKHQVDMCEGFTTCETCIRSADPICGWCSLERRCTRQVNCSTVDTNQLEWKTSVNQCPAITRAEPPVIFFPQLMTGRTITLQTVNIPTGLNYLCVFDFGNLGNRVEETATHNGDQVTCPFPASSQIPALPAGQDTVDSEVSLRYTNGVDFVTLAMPVGFTDCSVHTSCTSCINSRQNCGWCPFSFQCLPHQLAGVSCQGSEETMNNSCPAIRPHSLTSNYLVHTNYSYPRNQLTIEAENLRNFADRFQQGQFWCVICTGSNCLFNLSASLNQDGTVVTCEAMEFQYPGNESIVNATLRVVWNVNDRSIDNPQNAGVTLYSCPQMGTNCAQCLSIPSAYNCSHCRASGGSGNPRCMFEEMCGGVELNSPSEVGRCDAPIIEDFFPKSGPQSGGTEITITGSNLGAVRSDILSVMIDGVGCPVTEYWPGISIKCVTNEEVSRLVSDFVSIRFGYRNDSTTSQEQFTYEIPSLANPPATPNKGPQSGGTNITIRGEHLGIGSFHNVTVANRECRIYEIRENSIMCETSPSDVVSEGIIITVSVDNWMGDSAGFAYVADPTFESISPNISFASGGTNYTISGTNLNSVQQPRLLFYMEGVAEQGRRRRQTAGQNYVQSQPCTVDAMIQNPNRMQCPAPSILSTNGSVAQAPIGLLMDGVGDLLMLNSTVAVHPDPSFMMLEGVQEFLQTDDIILTIQGERFVFTREQISVEITPCRDQTLCVCTVLGVSSSTNTMECEIANPTDLETERPLTVTIHLGNQEQTVGMIRINEPLNLLVILIPVYAGVIVFSGAIFILVVAVFCRKTRQKDQKYDQLILELERLESSVARECKLGFAELQTDLDELTGDVAGCHLPYLDIQSYLVASLFPGARDHPVMHVLQVPSQRRVAVERAIRDFGDLIHDKKVLLIFIHTLEEQRGFTIRDKSVVGSLLMVALHNRLGYATEILRTLLGELIRRTVTQSYPKLLLRRTESVAERMLTNWLTFCLHGYIMEHTGQPLYLLYRAVKNQLEKGPIDVITGEARYSLSEQKLIRQKMDVEVIDATVDLEDGLRVPVKLQNCDTISQAKEKILDAMYKAAPVSQRPSLTSVDLEYLKSPMEHMILRDEDGSMVIEGGWKKINTLRHYWVQNNAVFRLRARKDHAPPGRTFDYPASLIATHCSRQRALSEAEDGSRVWHLFKQLDVEDPRRSPFMNKKMVTEIYLPRMLSTKSILQKFVDDLFNGLFNITHPPSSPSTVYSSFFPHSPGVQVPMGYAPGADAVPMAVKYLFDFLDDEAENARITDPDVVHTWKNNALSLRFWVNMIKNPEFVFDINKSHTVDACLSVIAQAFIDGCSSAEMKLTIDSPTSKLLYNKEVQGYKAQVKKYYQEVRQLPRIPEDAMQYYLKQLSVYQGQLMRKTGGFVTESALNELLRYATKYHEPFLSNLRSAGLESKAQMFEGVLRVTLY